MMRSFCMLILSITGAGCQTAEPLEIQMILGEFYNIDRAEDYSHLELKEDNTYHFDQAVSYSCEIWGHFYGEWQLDGDKLVLFKGIDLEAGLEVSSNENLESDTLTIFLSERFLEAFPDIKVSIGSDREDLEIKNHQIILDKYSYCEKNGHFDRTSKKDKQSTYQNYPMQLNFRSGNYFYNSYYILSKDKIYIDLGKWNAAEPEKKKLLEYKLVRGNLKSTFYTDWINKHELKRKQRAR